MKRIFFSLVAVALLFAACKKDDKPVANIPRIGSFTVKDSTKVTGIGTYVMHKNGATEIAFSDFLLENTSYSGKGNVVGFYIDTLAAGTYTYSATHDPAQGYDKTMMFYAAEGALDATYANGKVALSEPGYHSDPVSGSLTIKKDSAYVFELSYKVTFGGDSTFTGNYSGELGYIFNSMF